MIHYECSNGIAMISLAKDADNIIDEALIETLQAALQRFGADSSARVALLTTDGPVFSRGARLMSIGRTYNSDAARIVCAELDTLDKPIVAALRGEVSGSALEIVLACDWRIAAADTLLGFPEFSIGLPPGAGATQRLPALVGVDAALSVMLASTPCDAAYALKVGLVDSFVGENWHGDLINFAINHAGERRAQSGQLESTIANVAALMPSNFAERSRAERAVREAVSVGLSEGVAVGSVRELELYMECESSAEHWALDHVRQVIGAVEQRTILGQSLPSGQVRRVFLVGLPALEVTAQHPGTQVIALHAMAVLPDNLCGTDVVILSMKYDDAAGVVERAPDATFLLTECIEVDSSELATNVVCGTFYGPHGYDVLQLIDSALRLGARVAKCIDAARIVGCLCLHGTSTPIPDALFPEWARVQEGLAAAGVSGERIVAAASALRLPGILAAAELNASLPVTLNPSFAGLELDDEALQDALLCGLLNSGAHVLDRQLSFHPEDLDILLYRGYGIAVQNMPFRWGEARGVSVVYEELKQLKDSISPVFAPADLFERLFNKTAA